MTKNFVIIGSSAAGISAAEAIRNKNADSKITIISQENYPPYYRYLISSYLAGEIKESQLYYHNIDFFKENNINLLLNHKAVQTRPQKNTIVALDKQNSPAKNVYLEYDYLILACGASSCFPQIKGTHKNGVFGFRTFDDAKKISELLPITTTVCVVSNGSVGLEAAVALKKRGVEVKTLLKSEVISQNKLEENNIETILGVDVTDILGEGDVKAIRLNTGKIIGCSIVVIDSEFKPNIELAKDTEIKTSQGILVNECMRTNIANILAAGDVCEVFNPELNKGVVSSHWQNAVDQGKIAGENAF